MARAILSHIVNRISCLQLASTRWNPLAQGSAHYTAKTIQKARWTLRSGRRWGRGSASRGNRQLQDMQRNCTIPSALGRLYGVWGYMRNHRPPIQLYRHAQEVATEVPQEATWRKGGLTMTAGKHLPIETPRNGAVTWYLLPVLLVAISHGFFGERFRF